MYTNIKTKNGKELQLQALVDLGCTHTGIDKQLVKKEKIKTESIYSICTIRSGNQWTQRTNRCSGHGFKWHRHVFGI